jgi:hypothetical protein
MKTMSKIDIYNLYDKIETVIPELKDTFTSINIVDYNMFESLDNWVEFTTVFYNKTKSSAKYRYFFSYIINDKVFINHFNEVMKNIISGKYKTIIEDIHVFYRNRYVISLLNMR